jgi:hypothetical protein
MGPHFKSLLTCIKHLLSFSFVIKYIYNNFLFYNLEDFFHFIDHSSYLHLFLIHNLVIFQRFLYPFLSTTTSLHVVQPTTKRREQSYKKMRENDWPRQESET